MEGDRGGLGIDSRAKVALLEQRVGFLSAELQDLRQSVKEVKSDYVHKDHLAPLQRIGWIVTTVVVTGLVGAVLSLIVSKGNPHP